MAEPILTLTRQDFVIEWYSGTGPGGQNRNKVQACCRIRHPASGMVATGTKHRTRAANQRDAFRELARRIMPWIRSQIAIPAETAAPSDVVIRTYHEPRNEVRDKASGRRWPYGSDIGPMIEARRAAMIGDA